MLLLKQIWCCAVVLLLAGNSYAQKAAARYEIDTKRIGVSPTDRDAMPRGREFIRLDSTYYVGWMYQGLYQHDRSADVPGYQRALPMLRKAFLLIEKDYGGLLTTLYNDPMVYIQNNLRYVDYLTMARALREVYEYLEMPDSAMWVLDKVERKNFKRDFMGIAGARAWIIHRNRFYTSKDYAFLANSVQENEEKAKLACYAGFGFIKKHINQNNFWFGDGQSIGDRQYIYHYLALIHCYQKNYDSSDYYYRQMADAGTVSWNNYGSMKAETGDFAEATEMYTRDRYKNVGVKYLMEPYYYLPILQIYAGKTREAMKMAREAITYSNSSPGFGWYNIALARAFIYDGQLDSARHALDKAAGFKEIHIGTTLTQPQYDFTIGLLKLVWLSKKIEEMKFLHANWWYHPRWLYEVSALQATKYAHEYVLATQLALNPERERIIYDLFCGESTVGYDEIYYLMERFSPRYFLKLMQGYIINDPRQKLKRYFELYQARLLWHRGEKNEARADFNNLLNGVVVDTAHEKLFMGRLYESLAVAAQDKKDEANTMKFYNLLYDTYPQLIPFSEITPRVFVTFSGDDNAVIQQVKADFKSSRMLLQRNAGNYPSADIRFNKKGIKTEVVINVRNAAGKTMVADQRFIFTEPTGAGAEILLRMFGKEGAAELELPEKEVKNP